MCGSERKNGEDDPGSSFATRRTCRAPPETPASFWYYFEKDGKAAASKWLKLDSKWDYFNDAGQMQTGKTSCRRLGRLLFR